MRRLLMLTAVAWMLPAVSFAFDTANSLKQNMKQLGVLNKQITASSTDTNKNQQNAANAGQMVMIFKLVYDQAEDAVHGVPPDKKNAAIELFHKLTQEEIDLSTQLQASFQANDNYTAVRILQKMNEIKHEGHDRFDP